MASFGATGRMVEGGVAIGPDSGHTMSTMGGGSALDLPPPGSTVGPTGRPLPPPSKVILQRKGMEYDRRQIRRKLRARLEARGIPSLEQEQGLLPPTRANDDDNVPEFGDDGIGGAGDNDEDEASVYDDAEFYPWKQRESAVHAAAMGGRTEGRMEGFDSLDRALQAHEHNIHYGQGFGWSQLKQQQGDVGSTTTGSLATDDPKAILRARQQAAEKANEWTSFANLNKNADDNKKKKKKKRGGVDAELTEEELHHREDIRVQRRTRRQQNMISTVYVTVAVLVTLAFAYFVETIKIDSYQTYLPDGYEEQQQQAQAQQQQQQEQQQGETNGEGEGSDTNPSSRRYLEQPPLLPELRGRIIKPATTTGEYHPSSSLSRQLFEGPRLGVPPKHFEHLHHQLRTGHHASPSTSSSFYGLQQQVPDEHNTQKKAEQLIHLLQGIVPDPALLTTLGAPQHHAIMWMAREVNHFPIIVLPQQQHSPSTLSSSDSTPGPSSVESITYYSLVQRYALATLYFATNGPNWRVTPGFLSRTVECSWNVVSTDPQQTLLGAGDCLDGKIQRLQLPNNNLIGNLPADIGLLTNLRELDLSHNELFGNAVVPILLQLPNLVELRLEHNAFDTIDNETGQPTDLCAAQNGIIPHFSFVDCAVQPARANAADTVVGFQCPCCTQCCGYDTRGEVFSCWPNGSNAHQ